MNNKEFREKIKIITICIILISIVIIGIANLDTLLKHCNKLIDAITPFIYGCCFAYILVPLCNKLEEKIKTKHRELIAITLTEMMFISSICIISFLIIPQSFQSIGKIVDELPNAWIKLEDCIENIQNNNPIMANILGGDVNGFNEIVGNTLESTFKTNIDNIITSIINRTTDFGKMLFNIIIGIITNIFILANRKIFAKQLDNILYIFSNERAYNVIKEEIQVINKMFSGFFIGKIIDSIIVGVICIIVLLIMKMPYAMLISVIVCVTNIVPIAGPFIGAIPGVLIILSVDPLKALYFLIFIIILQQIDGHIIGPKCIGNTTGLSTFWVLFAIIVFGKLFGVVGMVIGVPTLAVIFDIGRKVLDYKLDNKEQFNTRD